MTSLGWSLGFKSRNAPGVLPGGTSDKGSSVALPTTPSRSPESRTAPDTPTDSPPASPPSSRQQRAHTIGSLLFAASPTKQQQQQQQQQQPSSSLPPSPPPSSSSTDAESAAPIPVPNPVLSSKAAASSSSSPPDVAMLVAPEDSSSFERVSDDAPSPDLSHTLPPHATVESVLLSGLSSFPNPSLLAQTLSAGIIVSKLSSDGYELSKKLAVNFKDGTLNLEHSLPFVSYLTAEYTEAYHLHQCSRPRDWRSSPRATLKVLACGQDSNPDVADRALAFEREGAPDDDVVLAFGTDEEYEAWKEALETLHGVTRKYGLFFGEKLGKEAAKAIELAERKRRHTLN